MSRRLRGETTPTCSHPLPRRWSPNTWYWYAKRLKKASNLKKHAADPLKAGLLALLTPSCTSNPSRASRAPPRAPPRASRRSPPEPTRRARRTPSAADSAAAAPNRSSAATYPAASRAPRRRGATNQPRPSAPSPRAPTKAPRTKTLKTLRHRLRRRLLLRLLLLRPRDPSGGARVFEVAAAARPPSSPPPPSPPAPARHRCCTSSTGPTPRPPIARRPNVGVRLREPVQVLRDPEPEFQDPRRTSSRRSWREGVGTRDDQSGRSRGNIRPRRHLKQSDGGRQRPTVSEPRTV